MLNISENTVSKDIEVSSYTGLSRVEAFQSGKVLIRLLTGFSIACIILLFVPWTQNIRSFGEVTTLTPQQRPQMVNSVIAGRVEQWYVREGDYVDKGDTILFISEIKDDYFDPALLERTRQQIDAKSGSIRAYEDKASALSDQIRALTAARDAKIEQAENKLVQSLLKVTTDSIDLEAKIINLDIAKQQLDRQQTLYDKGLKSLTDLEKRKLTLQKAQADKVAAENKLMAARASVVNARVELQGIEAKYREDVAKSSSDRFSALSAAFDASATVNKLENQYANYDARNGFYYITAPQNGYITESITSGIGETIKEGEAVVTIMPADYELAMETYVRPIDLPLLQKGQKVRIVFDGWPAIVFSAGWPNTAFGTFGGEIFAIDNFISPNGKYRVLVSQSKDDEPWPELLRVGGGTNSLILLQDVPIWYELWRQLNGFPPNFYTAENTSADKKKK